MFKVNDTVKRKTGFELHYRVFAVHGAHLWIGRDGSANPGVIVQASNFEKVAPRFGLGTFRHRSDRQLYKVVHLLDDGKKAVVVWTHTLTGSTSASVAGDPENFTKVS